MSAPIHIPVMLAEVVESLNPRAGGVYVDGTFGAGGYTRSILTQADCTVWAIDRDPDALERGQTVAAEFPGRLHLVHGCFGDMDRLLAGQAHAQVDGVALDVGVSSPQIDDPARGFSFRADGPLDMRMDRSGDSAADLVNELPEKDLADLIYTYGEERASRAVAKAIVAARREAPITRTGQLAEIVRSVVRPAKDKIDPATRTFQALRIAVNDELGELTRGLAAAERILTEGGRLVVVSFHSLEDRVVKDFFRQRSGGAARPSRHMPDTAIQQPTLKLLTRKAIRPSDAECAANARARSARLRAAERTAVPLPEAA
ncbi:MAG: 16S rRNA (cytosine(1402)-N(4))-methyltransferase RsmH [Magnetospiraceae bacterium]